MFGFSNTSTIASLITAGQGIVIMSKHLMHRKKGEYYWLSIILIKFLSENYEEATCATPLERKLFPPSSALIDILALLIVAVFLVVLVAALFMVIPIPPHMVAIFSGTIKLVTLC